MRLPVFILLSVFTLLASNENIRRILENPSAFEDIEKLYCLNSLISLYEENGFEPFWTDDVVSNAFSDSISLAFYEGLDPEDYHYTYLNKNRAPSSSPGIRDIVLTDAFLLYGTHLLEGKLDPVSLHPEWNAQRRKDDILEIFRKQAGKNSLFNAMEMLKPQNISYTELKKKLRYYLDQPGDINKNIPKGKLIRPGENDKRMPDIRENLTVIEKVSLTSPEDSLKYDSATETVLKQFQNRHGLISDGIIGDNTVRMLNLSLKQRTDKIKVNLERLRWMPENYGELYILINLADYRLSYYRDGKLERKQNLIIGKSYRKTPVFSDKMRYIVINPSWTVPYTILYEDVIPAMRKDKEYLKRKNIRIFKNEEVRSAEIPSETIDWNSARKGNFPYKLIQDPGPNNSLGEVKFMFPNQYNIYLHDTPDKSLFLKEERNFSSGCLRLEDPLGFAETLLSDEVPGWNMDRLKSIIQTRKETTVPLPRPVDVHIQYLTTWVDDGGVIQFRNDVYDRDHAVLEGLSKKGQSKGL